VGNGRRISHASPRVVRNMEAPLDHSVGKVESESPTRFGCKDHKKWRFKQGVVVSLQQNFGFLRRPTASPDLFFHFSEVLEPESLSIGQCVKFDVARSSDSRPIAKKLRPLPPQSIIVEELWVSGARGVVLTSPPTGNVRVDALGVDAGGLSRAFELGYALGAGLSFGLNDVGNHRLHQGDVVTFDVVLDFPTKTLQPRHFEILQRHEDLQAHAIAAARPASDETVLLENVSLLVCHFDETTRLGIATCADPDGHEQLQRELAGLTVDLLSHPNEPFSIEIAARSRQRKEEEIPLRRFDRLLGEVHLHGATGRLVARALRIQEFGYRDRHVGVIWSMPSGPTRGVIRCSSLGGEAYFSMDQVLGRRISVPNEVSFDIRSRGASTSKRIWSAEGFEAVRIQQDRGKAWYQRVLRRNVEGTVEGTVDGKHGMRVIVNLDEPAPVASFAMRYGVLSTALLELKTRRSICFSPQLPEDARVALRAVAPALGLHVVEGGEDGISVSGSLPDGASLLHEPFEQQQDLSQMRVRCADLMPGVPLESIQAAGTRVALDIAYTRKVDSTTASNVRPVGWSPRDNVSAGELETVRGIVTFCSSKGGTIALETVDEQVHYSLKKIEVISASGETAAMVGEGNPGRDVEEAGLVCGANVEVVMMKEGPKKSRQSRSNFRCLSIQILPFGSVTLEEELPVDFKGVVVGVPVANEAAATASGNADGGADGNGDGNANGDADADAIADINAVAASGSWQEGLRSALVTLIGPTEALDWSDDDYFGSTPKSETTTQWRRRGASEEDAADRLAAPSESPQDPKPVVKGLQTFSFHPTDDVTNDSICRGDVVSVRLSHRKGSSKTKFHVRRIVKSPEAALDETEGTVAFSERRTSSLTLSCPKNPEGLRVHSRFLIRIGLGSAFPTSGNAVRYFLIQGGDEKMHAIGVRMRFSRETR